MVRELSSGLQEISIRELNEDPNTRDEILKDVREWLQNHPDIKPRVIDDQWLMAFLRGSKFNLDKTKEKLEQYYKAKTLYPNFTTYGDPFSPRLQRAIDANLFLILPQREGSLEPRISISRFDDFDPSVMDFDDSLVVIFMIFTILLIEDDNFIVNGLKGVSFTEKFPLRIIFKFTPRYMKGIQFSMIRAFPLRLKMLGVVYNSYLIAILYKLFKSLVPKKISERFMLFTKDNYENLYEHVPKHLLPKDYGGDNGTVEEIGKYWKKKIESYAHWFKDEHNYYNNDSS